MLEEMGLSQVLHGCQPCSPLSFLLSYQVPYRSPVGFGSPAQVRAQHRKTQKEDKAPFPHWQCSHLSWQLPVRRQWYQSRLFCWPFSVKPLQKSLQLYPFAPCTLAEGAHGDGCSWARSVLHIL